MSLDLSMYSYLHLTIHLLIEGSGQQQSGLPPPTPSQMTFSSTSFESEERGDLIFFYNQVYVQQMKAFALKFRAVQEV